MPDGTIFVASGSFNGLDPAIPSNNNPTYEILNRDGTPRGANYKMDILVRNQPYYMYPFVHLLKDGNLFVFVAKSCQLFNVPRNQVVRDLPGKLPLANKSKSLALVPDNVIREAKLMKRPKY